MLSNCNISKGISIISFLYISLVCRFCSFCSWGIIFSGGARAGDLCSRPLVVGPISLMVWAWTGKQLIPTTKLLKISYELQMSPTHTEITTSMQMRLWRPSTTFIRSAVTFIRSKTMATTMSGEGRTQSGGRVPANNDGDGVSNKEAWVARLSSDPKDSLSWPLKASRSKITRLWTTLHL